MVDVHHGWFGGLSFEIVEELIGRYIAFAGSIDMIEFFAQGDNIFVLRVWIHENFIIFEINSDI